MSGDPTKLVRRNCRLFISLEFNETPTVTLTRLRRLIFERVPSLPFADLSVGKCYRHIPRRSSHVTFNFPLLKNFQSIRRVIAKNARTVLGTSVSIKRSLHKRNPA